MSLFLGRLTYVWPAGDKARFEPRARLEGEQWVALPEDDPRFRPTGLVFYPKPLPPPALTTSTWVFEIEPNQLSGSKDHDTHIAIEPRLAWPLVDLSTHSLENARKILFETGITLPHPSNREVVVLLEGGMWCRLSFSPSATDRHTATYPGGTHAVSLFGGGEGWLPAATGKDGLRFFPGEALPSNPSVRNVPWCSDLDFAERVFRRFQKLDQEGAQQLHLTSNAIKFVARTLDRQGLLKEASADPLLDIERLKSVLPNLLQRTEIADLLRTSIVESPEFRKVMSVAEAEIKERLEVELRAALEPQIRETLGTEFADLDQHVKSLQERWESLQRQCTEQEQRVEAARSDAAKAESSLVLLRDRFAATLTGIQSLAMDLASLGDAGATRMVARLEAALEGVPGDHGSLVPDAVPAWNLPMDRGYARILEEDELPGQLGIASQAYGVDPDLMAVLDSFARAGEVVVLTGEGAENLSLAYSKCVAGSATYGMSLDPSVIGMDDLWRTPGSGQPTALAWAWHAARNLPSRTSLVVLRGLANAPWQFWLTALAAARTHEVWPANLLTVIIAGAPGPVIGPSAKLPDLDRIVTLEAGSCPVGPEARLRALAQPLVATALRWRGESHSLGHLDPAWLQQLSELPLDPFRASRCLRVGAIAKRDHGDRISSELLPWMRYLAKGAEGIPSLPSAFRAGLESLAKLNHQT